MALRPAIPPILLDKDAGTFATLDLGTFRYSRRLRFDGSMLRDNLQCGHFNSKSLAVFASWLFLLVLIKLSPTSDYYLLK
jgi:hypothetical protein